MTAAIAAIALLAQAPAGQSAPDIISNMLKKYHEATSVRGTIEFNQSAVGDRLNTKVSVLSTVQAAKPNKFFLEQRRIPAASDVSVPNSFLAVSDGQRMVYTTPKDRLPWTDRSSGKHDRLYEPAPKTIDEGLNAFCVALLDRSLPIAVAFYNTYEIQLVTNRLSELELASDISVDGVPAYRIKAQYTLIYGKPRQSAVKIPAYIYIDKSYNLLGVIWEEGLVDGGKALKITSQWIVRLQVNSQLDEALFRVR